MASAIQGDKRVTVLKMPPQVLVRIANGRCIGPEPFRTGRRGVLIGVLACAVILIGACAPTAGQRTVELMVLVTTDCELGADLTVSLGGRTASATAIGRATARDASGTRYGNLRIPGARGEAFRVEATHACPGERTLIVDATRVTRLSTGSEQVVLLETSRQVPSRARVLLHGAL